MRVVFSPTQARLTAPGAPVFNKGNNRGSNNGYRGGFRGRNNNNRPSGASSTSRPSQPSYAPAGHPYKGKHFNPNHVTANATRINPPVAAALAPPPYSSAPAPGGQANLSSILNGNWAPISANMVTLGTPDKITTDTDSISSHVTDVTDGHSISDDDKPSYTMDMMYNIFGSDDDDVDVADVEDNEDMVTDDMDVASMTSEQLDAAHDIFVTTINNGFKEYFKGPSADDKAATKASGSGSSDDEMPALIHSSSDESDTLYPNQPLPPPPFPMEQP